MMQFKLGPLYLFAPGLYAGSGLAFDLQRRSAA
jgi:hypothetical protein